MDSTHMHLLLNHIPVIGTLVGLLLLVVALARRSDELKQASLAIFVVGALVAVPAYLTGESAEELVEHLAGVSESLIERHEDAAQLALAAAGLLGVFALSGLVLLRRSTSAASRVVVATLVLAVATSGLMARAANLGGQIRHTEIRPFHSAPLGNSHAGRSHGDDDD